MKQLSILNTCMTAYRRRAKTRAAAEPEKESPEQQPSEVATDPKTRSEQRTKDEAAQQTSRTFTQTTDDSAAHQTSTTSIQTTGSSATHQRWISSPSLGITTTSTVCISTDTDTTLDATSSSQDVFPFFRLPGELRNKIYRYVILQNTPILVNSAGYQRSGLMSVSKQARSETVSIFYSENRFRSDVSEYNSDNLLQFVRRLSATERQRETDHKTLLWPRDSTPNWRNLMIWLQRWYNRERFYGFRPPNDIALGRTEYAKEIALGGLFVLVTELRDLPWARVEKMLLDQRPILVSTDERWGKD